jgi:hypothetical protein
MTMNKQEVDSIVGSLAELNALPEMIKSIDLIQGELEQGFQGPVQVVTENLATISSDLESLNNKAGQIATHLGEISGTLAGILDALVAVAESKQDD